MLHTTNRKYWNGHTLSTVVAPYQQFSATTNGLSMSFRQTLNGMAYLFEDLAATIAITAR
jgi:hypothetical protein